MLQHLTKEAIGRWHQRIAAIKAGGAEVHHLRFIASSLWAQITVYTKLKADNIQKPEGEWTSWDLEDLVRVLNKLAHSGEKSQTFTVIDGSS